MKIGIITIQKSEVNYGACLQCYALWKYISKMGHDCEVIDLLRPCHKEYSISPDFGEKSLSMISKIRKFIHSHFHIKIDEQQLLRINKYHVFNDEIKYSDCYESVDKLYQNSPHYEVYITGSDQVWNPNMPFVNAPYFLDFVKDNGKRISYASSFGVEFIPESLHAIYKKWLMKYDYLSTREKSGAKMIEQLSCRTANVVMDPVFLLEGEEWKKMMVPYNKIEQHEYIFLYLLHFDRVVLEQAKNYARNKKLPLYVVLSESRIIEDQEIVQLKDIGPAEWMWLIGNAVYVLTTSFHGSAFCIILETPFITFLNRNNHTNSRIVDLMDSLNLSQNLLYVDDIHENYEIPAFKFNTKDLLCKLVSESKNFLAESIDK